MLTLAISLAVIFGNADATLLAFGVFGDVIIAVMVVMVYMESRMD